MRWRSGMGCASLKERRRLPAGSLPPAPIEAEGGSERWMPTGIAMGFLASALC